METRDGARSHDSGIRASAPAETLVTSNWFKLPSDPETGSIGGTCLDTAENHIKQSFLFSKSKAKFGKYLSM